MSANLLAQLRRLRGSHPSSWLHVTYRNAQTTRIVPRPAASPARQRCSSQDRPRVRRLHRGPHFRCAVDAQIRSVGGRDRNRLSRSESARSTRAGIRRDRREGSRTRETGGIHLQNTRSCRATSVARKQYYRTARSIAEVWPTYRKPFDVFARATDTGEWRGVGRVSHWLSLGAAAHDTRRNR